MSRPSLLLPLAPLTPIDPILPTSSLPQPSTFQPPSLPQSFLLSPSSSFLDNLHHHTIVFWHSVSPNSSITLSTFSFLCLNEYWEGRRSAAEKLKFSLTVNDPITISSYTKEERWLVTYDYWACVWMRGQMDGRTWTTYPDAHLKFLGSLCPLINTSPVTPLLLLRPARMSNRLQGEMGNYEIIWKSSGQHSTLHTGICRVLKRGLHSGTEMFVGKISQSMASQKMADGVNGDTRTLWLLEHCDQWASKKQYFWSSIRTWTTRKWIHS